MDEFSAAAHGIVEAIGEARAAIILSRDGMLLGSSSSQADEMAKPSWLKVAALGEPERGFVGFPDELWAFARRGRYAAFVLADPDVRPGILLDRMEQALLSVEDTHTPRREPLRLPDSPGVLPTTKPRSSLHRPRSDKEKTRTASTRSPAPPADLDVRTNVAAADTVVAASVPVAVETASEPSSQRPPAPEAVRASDQVPQSVPSQASESVPSSVPDLVQEPEADHDAQVDRVLLAKEFFGLLQPSPEADEGSL